MAFPVGFCYLALNEPPHPQTLPRGAYFRMLSVPLLGGVRGWIQCMRKNQRSHSMNKRHRLSRRNFLKTSIASLTTLTIVPRHVLGGAGFTPPSEVLTRAVIGTGGMGMGHITGINTACKLLAVCDVDERHLA